MMGRVEYLAGIVTFAVGAPLLFLLASALADGEVRRRDAPLRARLGAAGVVTAAGYGWGRVAEELERIYATALARSPVPAAELIPLRLPETPTPV